MNALQFEARVNAILDERRDPLDQPDVIAYLERHPEALLRFARQRDDLSRLQRTARPTENARAHAPQTAHRWRRVGAIATGTAVAAAVAIVAVAVAPPAATPAAAAASAATHPPRIVSASLVQTRSPARIAGSFALRQPLVANANTLLEHYETWSKVR